LQELCLALISMKFAEYPHLNLQARILSQALIYLYKDSSANKTVILDMIGSLADIIIEGEDIEMAVRTITNLLEHVEQEAIVKEFYEYVPPILGAILSAFTSDEITSHGREQLLHIFYLCLRTISWADGIDN